MKAKFSVDGSTTPSQHIALSNFFAELALGAGAKLVCGDVLLDEEDENEGPGQGVIQPAATQTAEQVVAAGTEAPKRRRRTKAELEAEAAAAATTAQTEPVAETGNAQSAPTPDVAVTAPPTVAAVSPSDDYEKVVTAPAATGGKQYSEAEVQDLAGKVARAVGPEVVKGKISELGAARIGDLNEEQRNQLAVFLQSKLP